MAEAHLHEADRGPSAENNYAEATSLLKRASDDYAGMEDQSGPNNQANLRRLEALLVKVRQAPNKVGRADG
jgi:hypothetical protein